MGHQTPWECKKVTPGGSPAPSPAPTPNPTPAPGRGTCSKAGEDCSSTGCCKNARYTCYTKNKWFAGCRRECTPGSPDPNDPPAFQMPWECKKVLRGGSNTISSSSSGSDDE